MNGFVNHLISSVEEMETEMSMDILNESQEIENEIDSMDWDDEFSNEELPGTIGGNVDGHTNLNLNESWEDDVYEDEYLFDEEDDLDDEESFNEAQQQFYGLDDEDLFETQQKKNIKK